MAGTGPPADHPPPDSGRYEPIYSGSCTDPRHRPTCCPDKRAVNAGLLLGEQLVIAVRVQGIKLQLEVLVSRGDPAVGDRAARRGGLRPSGNVYLPAYPSHQPRHRPQTYVQKPPAPGARAPLLAVTRKCPKSASLMRWQCWSSAASRWLRRGRISLRRSLVHFLCLGEQIVDHLVVSFPAEYRRGVLEQFELRDNAGG